MPSARAIRCNLPSCVGKDFRFYPYRKEIARIKATKDEPLRSGAFRGTGGTAPGGRIFRGYWILRATAQEQQITTRETKTIERPGRIPAGGCITPKRKKIRKECCKDQNKNIYLQH